MAHKPIFVLTALPGSPRYAAHFGSVLYRIHPEIILSVLEEHLPEILVHLYNVASALPP